MIRVWISVALLVFCVGTRIFGEDALILQATGTVEVQGNSGSSWIAAPAGTELFADDTVRTGGDGHVSILFADGSKYDMLPQSVLTIKGTREARFFKRLWSAITGKLADTRYTSAYVGGVGTLRGEGIENEVIFNDALDSDEGAELARSLAEIDQREVAPEVGDLLRAVIFEQFGQFVYAEALYIEYLAVPAAPSLVYDLLLELYIKLDFYSHAQNLLAAREHDSDESP